MFIYLILSCLEVDNDVFWGGGAAALIVVDLDLDLPRSLPVTGHVVRVEAVSVPCVYTVTPFI